MNRKIFFFCFILAFLPRFAFLFFRQIEDPSWSHYWNLSSGLLKFGTFGYSGEQVTNIEPGYPFFLAMARAFSGQSLFFVFLIQVIAASLGAPLLHALTFRLTASRAAALFSAAGFAFYPYMIGQSAVVIEVPLFTTLLIAACLCYVRADQKADALSAVLCGFIFGITVLVRSMVLPAFFLGILVFALRRKWLVFWIAGAVAFAVTAPWFLRNYQIDGSLIPPRGGWNLLQGSCPYSKKIIPEFNPDLLDAYVSILLDKERPELANAEDRPTLGKEVDDYFSMKAWDYIRSHPAEMAWLKIKNIFYLFHPRIVPFKSMDRNTRIEFTGPEDFRIEGIPARPAGYELSYTLTYAPVFLLACAGIFIRRKQWKGDLFLYLIALNFTLLYAFYWPATRLRCPMDFVLMVFAAAAFEHVYRKISCRNLLTV